MKVRIEAVISTAGNNEEYVGRHLGLKLIGRPFTKMVVTFEEELSDEEVCMLSEMYQHNFRVFGNQISTCSELKQICQELRFGTEAIQIHSVRIIPQ